MCDIQQHLDLIKGGYKGYIAEYTGEDQLSTKRGDLVLVRDERGGFATMEQPIPPHLIEGRLKVWRTCIGVPITQLKALKTK